MSDTVSPITTHVLDTSIGRPAAGIEVTLEVAAGSGWRPVGRGTTDDDGRVRTLLPAGSRLDEAVYRITFATGPYLERQGGFAFYPEAAIVFRVHEPERHYHVPLLLNPFGYSTYRGS